MPITMSNYFSPTGSNFLPSEHWSALALANRLRAECEAAPDAPLEPQRALPLFFPVACVLVASLSVASLSEWLRERKTFSPNALRACGDRRLRGAIVAYCGRGMLFADAGDTPAEQRFTLAHEAAHFLGDHYYPRLDAMRLHGREILEVVDGLRAPTAAERIDSALRRVTLEQHVHLLAREGNILSVPRLDEIEARADAFACEILAPFAALEQRFSALDSSMQTVAHIQSTLVADFGLPLAHAAVHARAFVAAHGRRRSLADSLSLHDTLLQ